MTEWASLKIADQGGICPICRKELLAEYGDSDAPEYVISTEHYKAQSDAFKILGVCRDHAQLLALRLWAFLPPVEEDE